MKNVFQLLICLLLLAGTLSLAAQEAAKSHEEGTAVHEIVQETTAANEAMEEPEAAASAEVHPERPDALYWAIGICMGMGSLAAGLAVGKVGAAALGAAAEKPELLGKAIAFVGLGEGIALFGFLISLFLYLKI